MSSIAISGGPVTVSIGLTAGLYSRLRTISRGPPHDRSIILTELRHPQGKSPTGNKRPAYIHRIRLLRLLHQSHPAATTNPPLFPAAKQVAGLGTRVLPATKAMPKEMLTIVDRPLIQYVFDEAREAGIEHFVFVTGRNKNAIEDHFDRQFELDETLKTRGKQTEINLLTQFQPEAGAVSFTRQQAPLGLGHAVWCARDIVGHEPFAVVLPDELVLNTPGCL